MPIPDRRKLAELFEGGEVSAAVGAEAESQIEKKYAHLADASESSCDHRQDLMLKKAQTIDMPQKSSKRR